MGVGVWSLGFGVWGLGFRFWVWAFGVWGLGFGVDHVKHVREKLLKGNRIRGFLREIGARLGSVFVVSGWGLGSRIWFLGREIRISGFDYCFRSSGFGFRNSGVGTARVRPTRSQPPTLHHHRGVVELERRTRDQMWPRASCAVHLLSWH